MNYKIIIDKTIIESYGNYYKKLHPRSVKHPLAKNKKSTLKPIYPSINEWMVMLRPQMNAVKQNWKDFICWVVSKYGFENEQLKSVKITIRIYQPTRREFDLDNYAPKFVFDGLVESGMLIDDNVNVIKKLTLEGGYDKDNPRTEIEITEV